MGGGLRTSRGWEEKKGRGVEGEEEEGEWKKKRRG